MYVHVHIYMIHTSVYKKQKKTYNIHLLKIDLICLMTFMPFSCKKHNFSLYGWKKKIGWAQDRALLETSFVIYTIILLKWDDQASKRPRETQQIQCTALVPRLNVRNEGHMKSRAAETIQHIGLAAFCTYRSYLHAARKILSVPLLLPNSDMGGIIITQGHTINFFYTNSDHILPQGTMA